MEKFIQSLFGKKATNCITSLPIVLFLSSRDKDGKIIEPNTLERWLSYVIDRIPSTMDCISDTVTNLAMSKHYQPIEEEIKTVTIHSSDYSITSDELERIIASLIKFGENTDQSNVKYELNGTTYHLPI